MQFLDDLKEVWQPGYISSKRKDDIQEARRRESLPTKEKFEEVNKLIFYPTDYVVIGPLSNDIQVATGDCNVAIRFSCDSACCIIHHYITFPSPYMHTYTHNNIQIGISTPKCKSQILQ